METRQVNSPPVFLVVIVLLLLSLNSHLCLEYTATHVRVPNECDFLTCEEGPHVKSISDEAREPPRQRLSRYKYLAPADNVKTVILIEQCYAACFDRYLPQDSDGISKEYVLPNTATLSCMDNMEVFLCIATCAFHVNSKLPGYKANFTSTSYTDIYSPKKEIEFQLDRLKKILELKEIEALFDPVGSNGTIIAVKGKIAKLEGLMPMSAECKSFCNVTEYGICDTAFEGNEQNEKCKETCNYDLCSEMCDVGKNISHALASQTETLLLTLTPAGPPRFHLKHNPRRQEVYPAAYYNISGTKPHSLDGPVGLVWKVQNVSVTSYYPFNFQHPFIGEVDRSYHQPDLYHLYTQNNHSGSGGYLNIIEFCKAANVSFAIVTKRGVSSFSPPSEVCFPGVYYPSPPISMSLNAEYDDGKLILNISLKRSIDQSLIDAYELEAYLLGNESNTAGRDSELFKHTFPPNQSLVLTILGRDGIKDYNLYSIWDRELVFKTSVLPKSKKARQKETSFVYHLKEPQLYSPGIEYTKHFEFDNITGLLNLIVELQLITDSWISSTETFINYSTYSIHYVNETIASLDVFPNETVTFSRLRPLMKEHYKLNVRHSCCLMANTRYKDRFKNHSEVLETKPIPSRLSNLTANFDIKNASTVVATIEWTSSEEPYGISEFQIVISHIDISVLIANDTVKILNNDTVQPLQIFKWKLTLPLSTGGTFIISVHAISRWNTASEIITTAIYVPTTGTQVQYDIRLSGGSVPNEGRVEVYYGYNWRIICDYSWDIYDAHVACRQLGYHGAIRAYNNSYFSGRSLSTFTSYMYCIGTESYISECSRSGDSCSSSQTAGVVCSPKRITEEGAVRLASGQTASEGRFEIFMQGHWNTICGRGTSSATASVVCKQLGYSGSVLYHGSFYPHGSGRGLIAMQYVQCGGHEDNLLACSRNPLYDDNGCSHSNDIGALCANDGDVRLVSGSSTKHIGRVEVYYNNQWQTVCDNNWDILDANVVCRQLGYYGAQSAYKSAHYGAGSGLILLDNLTCNATESTLLKCSHNGLGVRNCTHSQDASVACYNLQDGRDAVRLVDGPTANEGRVEVFFANRWHTICDDNWDIDDAHTVCRYLGYSGASAALGSAFYGEGTGEIILENVGCSGSGQSPVYCSHNGLFVTKCTHKQDAGVVCHKNGDVRLVPTSQNTTRYKGRVEVFNKGRSWYPVSAEGWDLLGAHVVCRQLGYSGGKVGKKNRPLPGTYTALTSFKCVGMESNLLNCEGADLVELTSIVYAEVECNEDSSTAAAIGDVRLVNYVNLNEGQVEVWLNGRWFVMCDDRLSTTDAGVVCKQLGYRSHSGVPSSSDLFVGSGEGDNLVFPDDRNCRGDENSLLSCGYFRLQPQTCSQSEDTGIACSDLRNGDVRLVGGSTAHSGRVEVYSEGRWYTVCDSFWDLTDAHVVCTQLGYKGAVKAHKNAHFGRGSGGILMDHVSCTGLESSLLECPSRSNVCSDCTHANDAGVTCANEKFTNIDGIRLTDGTSANKGRVEMWMGGRWHSICDDIWDETDGSVVCRSLGYSRATGVSGNANYGEGKGDIILDNVMCVGNETNIAYCDNLGIFQENCGHSEDAGVTCQQEGDVRLVNGMTKREGRVEIFNNGQWRSICGKTWNFIDAFVVCRQLGYKGVDSYSSQSQFGHGKSILRDYVNCEGIEGRLVDCLEKAQVKSKCRGQEASVTCQSLQYSPGDLRLVNGTDTKEGLVEMFYNGYWSGLCGPRWNSVTADVVCKDLGYDTSESIRSTDPSLTTDGSLYNRAYQIKISDPNCAEDGIKFLECDHDGLIPHGCGTRDVFHFITCA